MRVQHDDETRKWEKRRASASQSSASWRINKALYCNVSHARERSRPFFSISRAYISAKRLRTATRDGNLLLRGTRVSLFFGLHKQSCRRRNICHFFTMWHLNKYELYKRRVDIPYIWAYRRIMFTFRIAVSMINRVFFFLRCIGTNRHNDNKLYICTLHWIAYGKKTHFN